MCAIHAYSHAHAGRRALDEPAILAWETGNELLPPANWTAAVAAYIKALDPNHLVLDGTYGVNPEALTIAALDIVSDHFYPVDAGRLATGTRLAADGGKAYFAGEFGWTSGDVAGFMAALQNGTAAGDCYWSLFPHLDSWGYEQHMDGFTVHWPGDDSAMVSAAAALRGHAAAMGGGGPPGAGPAPLAPRVTLADASGGRLAWRGAAGGASYSYETAPDAAGPFAPGCTRCATDNQTPLSVPPPAPGSWVRVRAHNVDGEPGAYSEPAEFA